MNTKFFYQLAGLKLLTFLILTAFSLLFCSGVRKEYTKASAGSLSAKPTPYAIAEYEPALAVRAAACVTCHAEFRSNIITDFGYGSPYFFGNPESGNKVGPFNGNIYGDFMAGSDRTGWLTAKFHKDIIVPEMATIEFDLKQSADGIINDQALYTEAFKATSLAGYLRSLEKQKEKPSKVIEKKKVFIGAPNAAALRSRFGITDNFQNGLKYINDDGDVSSFDAGIKIAKNKNYYTNSGAIILDGDLFVPGTLFLDNPAIVTNNGCRIYATGPVFMQGPVTFKNDNAASNLQLVSAEAIFLGVGQKICHSDADSNPMSLRLLKSPARPSIYTRVSVDRKIPPEKLTQELYDAAATLPLEDSTCHDETLSFSKILLNAPIIHSRYKGKFKGLVIAEFVLFWQGETDFEFDPVFKEVPVLPMLDENDYLVVE